MLKLSLVVIISLIIFYNSQAFANVRNNSGLIISFILLNYSEIFYEISKGKGDYLESLLNELNYADKRNLLIRIEEYVKKYKNPYDFAKNVVKDFN